MRRKGVRYIKFSGLNMASVLLGGHYPALRDPLSKIHILYNAVHILEDHELREAGLENDCLNEAMIYALTFEEGWIEEDSERDERIREAVKKIYEKMVSYLNLKGSPPEDFINCRISDDFEDYIRK